MNVSQISPNSSYSIPVESPENIEMGGKIDSIVICVAPLWKTFLRFILYLCTGFIAYLFSLWIPSIRIALSLSRSSLSRATTVVIYGADKNVEIVPLVREKTSTKELQVFTYRLFKYFYDDSTETFKPCQFKIESLTFNEIHSRYGQGLDENTVFDSSTFFGQNLTDIPKKSCVSLLMEEVLSPFYIFQVYSIIIWALDAYLVYAIIIFVFSATSVILTLYETMQTRKKLRAMSYYEISVNVYRKIGDDIVKSSVNSSELIPGDLIEIPENTLMPCDVILLNGSCIMNEAMLTGESIPVIKNSLPYNDVHYSMKDDKQYTLYAGTRCIQARYYQGKAVLGLVTLTGFATVKGELIRTMLFPKKSDFKFYSDSFKFIGILAFMAIIGFLIDLPVWLNSDDSTGLGMIIIKASEIVTVTVPPALPTCMQVGISIALSRLKKSSIHCISPNKVNETGRINVMCFDKTGTLTEDGLDLLGVRSVFFDKNTNKLSFSKLVTDLRSLNSKIDKPARDVEILNYMNMEGNSKRQSIYRQSGLLPSEQMMEIMAVCHSLTYVNGNMIGDPLDIKMFESTGWTFEENHEQKYDGLVLAVVRPPSSSANPLEYGRIEAPVAGSNDIGLVRRFEFSSKLQRMSVVVKNLQETGFKVHIKGSPEKIRELCRPESIPKNFHHVLEKYTEDGYRVLACATKITSLNYRKIMAASRDDVEKDFTFIGFLVMENRLKPVTTNIIDLLHSAEIRTIMVTGDNALTAISVARQCHIVGQSQKIFLGDVNETKTNGSETIAWKDFEHSERKLNTDLEPDFSQDSADNAANDSSSGRLFSKTMMPNSSSNLQNTFINTDRASRFSLHKKAAPFNPLTQPLYNDQEGNMVPQQAFYGAEANIMSLHAPFFHMQGDEDYCIAVTGKAFSLIVKEAEANNNPQYKRMLQKLLTKCLVFARMHPDEKALMIRYMMTNPKNIVGMCGDGANDVGALKAANVGISLSEAEASIAAPFTSNIQDISCVPTTLREGRAGLSTSFQAFKYMALYSIIQFTTVTVLYFEQIDLTNWAYYHIDIFIILSLSASMAMSGSYEHLTKYKPTGRLMSVQILSSVIGQGIIQISFQIGVYILLKYQSWYIPTDVNFTNEADANAENTTLYLLSLYQYCVVAFVFIVGRPFRKPFYTNISFTLSLVLLLIINVVLTFNPLNWEWLYSTDLAAEVAMDPEWRTDIFIISIINSIVTVLWEVVVVRYVSRAWKQHRDRRDRMKNMNASMNYSENSRIKIN